MDLSNAALAVLFRKGHGLHMSMPIFDILIWLRREKDRCVAIFSEMEVQRQKIIHLKKKKELFMPSIEYKQNGIK